MSRHPRPIRSKTVIGWVEFVSLPTVCSRSLEAKVDTGAETCALHATNIKVAGRFVSFKALGRSHRLRLREIRSVRSSNGSESLRPVVLLELCFSGRSEKVEFTLTNRDGMRFPILLGRNYLKDGFLVDAGFRFLLGNGSTSKRKKSNQSTLPGRRARKNSGKPVSAQGLATSPSKRATPGPRTGKGN